MNRSPSAYNGIRPPDPIYIGASWAVVGVGILSYLIGLWNAEMMLNEKGYYLTVLLLGLYAAISLQKTVRDKYEGLPVSGLYYGISWVMLGVAVLLLVVGLWRAQLLLSEKGFYGIAYILSLFGVITVQKNTRDTAAANGYDDDM